MSDTIPRRVVLCSIKKLAESKSVSNAFPQSLPQFLFLAFLPRCPSVMDCYIKV
ncbi:rCG35964 [Rattus norvegicus]|uniref:RCG35964 n=1 Tax=Rattus norvegicus TaxID=10116 RepID=A6IJQ3_RAT|nr:rCG35964 [Rattus norvegicus]